MSNDNKNPENKVPDEAISNQPLYQDYGHFEDQYLQDIASNPYDQNDFEPEPIYAHRSESLMANEPSLPEVANESSMDEVDPEIASSSAEDAKEAEAEVNMYTSDNAAIKYQHYLLLLDTLREDRHEQEYLDFVSSILADKEMLDDFDASPESLSKIDIEMAHMHLDKIKKHCPKTFAEVSKKIFDEDSSQSLIDAGIDVNNQQSNVPLSFPYDIAILRAYESTFPEEGKLPLKDRLAQFKVIVSGAASSESGKALIDTTLFALAAGVSGVGLPIATAIFATKMMENKKVQDLMTSIEEKTSKALIKLGFKEESINERKKPLGERMKEISETKWFKASKVPLIACSLAIGVGALAVTQFDIGVADIKAAADSVMSLPIPTVESAMALSGTAIGTASNLSLAAGAVIDAGVNMYQSAVDGASSGFTSTAEFFDRAVAATEKGIADAGVAAKDINNAVEMTSVDYSNAPAEHLSSATDVGASDITTNTTGSPEIPEAPSKTYTVETGDRLWNIAENHYLEATGEKPTPQQITAMINDLGLENPNMIYPGQSIDFTNDMSKYKDVTSVTADWLEKGVSGATEATAKEAVGTSIPVSPAEQVTAMQKFAEKQRDYGGINL